MARGALEWVTIHQLTCMNDMGGMEGARVPRAEADAVGPAVASLHREMEAREGVVWLWCGAFRRWRKRWVVLGTPGVMLLHKTRGAAHSRGSSSGGLGVLVQLAGATVMCSQGNDREFVVVTPSKWYYLRCEGPRDRAAWASSIGRAIVLYNQVLQARIALDVPLVHRTLAASPSTTATAHGGLASPSAEVLADERTCSADCGLLVQQSSRALEAAMAQAGCAPGAREALRTAVMGTIVGPLVEAVREARARGAEGKGAGGARAEASSAGPYAVDEEEGETSGASGDSDWELDSELDSGDDEFHDASSTFGDAQEVGSAVGEPCVTGSPGSGEGMVHQDRWCNVPAGDFVVRSAAYLHNRAKRPSEAALFELVGVDAFRTRSHKLVPVLPAVLSRGLLPHRLDAVCSNASAVSKAVGIPSLLMVSVSLPDYDVSMRNWGQDDGPGRTLVFFYRLTRETEAELERLDSGGVRDAQWPPHLRLLRRLASGCPRTLDCFKLVSGVANIRECRLSGAERALLQRYNRKPLLTRPQHAFARHGNTIEVALDVHRFAWAGRRGIQTFSSRFPGMRAELAFVIEGRTSEFLPERCLCAHTLCGFDLTRLPILA